jgi:amino acid adenylation domain-containing protein
VRLYDLYGPSEATTYATGGERVRGGRATIGRALRHMRAYVLDSGLEPAPEGVAGELYVGGAGLARGYLGRPGLTAARFIPDPFSVEAGARMYRTGDVARRLAGGELEYLGRSDTQVKVRGFRVELGEVEAALRAQGGVRQAAVAARERGRGDLRLVAYVVTEEGVTAGALVAGLRERLPEYMVPSAVVFVEGLPLTPSGKLDRRALPEPEWGESAAGNGDWVAPRTPVEEAIASVWGEVLNAGRVGLRENFFELGGHSLLAARVVSRLRNLFGVEVPLRSLFESPTVEGLAARVERGLAGGGAVAWPGPRPRAGGEGAAPLSFAQQRLWFLWRMEPESAAYNMAGALRLRGRLDVSALGRALSEIVRRHEALRTRYVVEGGRLVQVVCEGGELLGEVENVAALSEREREEELGRLLAEEASRPFDLEAGPVLRRRLVRVGEEEHVLSVVMHHVASDGWSLGVFVRELAELYEAFTRGAGSPLGKLVLQYADYAVWQREQAEAGALDAYLAYWRDRLAGAPALELATDYPRPAVQSYRGGTVRAVVGGALAGKLREVSRRGGATLFMTLLAGWLAVLHRYTGQADISVGVPAANRGRSEVEGLIGCFINTLVLRTDLSGGPTFRELLGRVREACLGAYQHQEVPFERVLEELQPEREVSRSPLFQVMFNLLNFDENEIKLEGLTIESLPTADLGAKSELGLYAAPRRDGIEFTLAYNADLFEEATARHVLRLYELMLESVVADAGRRVSDVSLLSACEGGRRFPDLKESIRSEQFAEFGSEEIEQSIPDRFARQVSAAPHALAVKTRRHEWTYAQLDQESCRVMLALLRLRGAGEGRVGVLMENGAPVVAALLGALKANKTYVPLDPSHPLGRLKQTFEDAQAEAVLTDGRHAASARELTGGVCDVINIDELPSAETFDVRPPQVSPEAVAYILYTSGSTGTPKGVMQSHRNVLHFIRAYTNNLKITRDDRLTLLPSFGFDAAVMDIYGALLNGAALYPMNLKEEGFDEVINSIHENSITVYHSTPTVFHSLAYRVGERAPGRVRLVVLGGEEARRSDAELCREKFAPHCVLVNGLGPTESTVSLQYFVTRERELRRASLPVGYPVDGTRVHLLDEEGRDVEMYGEIALESPYVALGYWRRPELTAAAFTDDPQGGAQRVYRTGDLGRRLHDGSIEFLGRKDLQVKIRGFRVELGEVEALLRRHAGVSECAVALKESSPGGEQRLVAYFVGDAGRAASGEELRASLGERLPAYMLPSAFVRVESLPLMPNGKVNRAALPQVFDFGRPAGSAYAPPTSDVERMLAKIWQDTLKVEKVGVGDSFFDLGGHSLLLLEVQSKLKEVFNHDVSVVDLFKYATISSLASYLSTPGAGRLPTLDSVRGRADMRIEAKAQRRRAIRRG